MWSFLFCASECKGCCNDCCVMFSDNNKRISRNRILRISVAAWLLNVVGLVISVLLKLSSVQGIIGVNIGSFKTYLPVDCNLFVKISLYWTLFYCAYSLIILMIWKRPCLQVRHGLFMLCSTNNDLLLRYL